MNRVPRLVLSLVFAGSLIVTGTASAADPEVEARFKKGVELYNEADFRSAAVEFRRAYEKGKNYKILYNIAQSEFQLTNYVAALQAFERYLKEGGTAIPPARREEVEQEIPKIRARVAAVTLTTNVQGAAVFVDDQNVGTAPLAEPVLMNPGSHRVSVRMDGWTEASRSVDVAGGETQTIELPLQQKAQAAPAATAETPATAAPVDDRSWAPAIIAWSATGVFAGGAVVFGLLAQSKSDDLVAAKSQPNTPASQLSDLDSSTGTFALVTDIAIGAAIVSGGLATYFTIDRASSKKTGRVRVTPTLGGVACGGTF